MGQDPSTTNRLAACTSPYLLQHAGNPVDWWPWCDEAIAAQPQAAADVRAGKVAAIGRIVGAVMKATGGRADGPTVQRLVAERLG